MTTETTATNDPGTTAQQPTGDPQQTTTQTGQTAAQTPPAGAPADWDGKVESLPEPVQKMIRDLRKEAGDRRTAANGLEQQQRDMVKAFAKAAGIELPGDEQTPNPEQLTQQLTASQQAARDSAVQLAVYKAAGTAGADADALLDSRRFLDSLADVDPADGAAITKAISDAVNANPKLKAGRAPGASSVDHGAAGSRETTTRTPRSLDEAVRASYGTA